MKILITQLFPFLSSKNVEYICNGQATWVMQQELNVKYRVFQKELYKGIPNVTVWLVI
jgi:hypothetical protein